MQSVNGDWDQAEVRALAAGVIARDLPVIGWRFLGDGRTEMLFGELTGPQRATVDDLVAAVASPRPRRRLRLSRRG